MVKRLSGCTEFRHVCLSFRGETSDSMAEETPLRAARELEGWATARQREAEAFQRAAARVNRMALYSHSSHFVRTM